VDEPLFHGVLGNPGEHNTEKFADAGMDARARDIPRHKKAQAFALTERRELFG
jgi:hypothetical protein